MTPITDETENGIADDQTSFSAEWHADQTRLGGYDEAEAPADVIDHGPCVAGHEWCDGVDGLFLGKLACFACFEFAPESAIETYDEWESDA